MHIVVRSRSVGDDPRLAPRPPGGPLGATGAGCPGQGRAPSAPRTAEQRELPRQHERETRRHASDRDMSADRARAGRRSRVPRGPRRGAFGYLGPTARERPSPSAFRPVRRTCAEASPGRRREPRNAPRPRRTRSRRLDRPAAEGRGRGLGAHPGPRAVRDPARPCRRCSTWTSASPTWPGGALAVASQDRVRVRLQALGAATGRRAVALAIEGVLTVAGYVRYRPGQLVRGNPCPRSTRRGRGPIGAREFRPASGGS